MKQPWGQHPIARDHYAAQSSYRGVDLGFQVDRPDAAEAVVCALAHVDGIAAIGRDWDYYNRRIHARLGRIGKFSCTFFGLPLLVG
jgi:hypothetical protein